MSLIQPTLAKEEKAISCKDVMNRRREIIKYWSEILKQSMCDLPPLQWRLVSDSAATNPEVSRDESTDLLETIKKWCHISKEISNGRAKK